MGISSREPPATPEAPQAPRALHSAQHDGCRQRHLNAQGVSSGQRHDGDGDGGTVHVDGGAQRDGDGVHILVQTQLSHRAMFTGMLAAELRVKKAVRPDSRRQRNTSG